MPISLASSRSFFRVKMEYNVPFTYVLTCKSSCSTRSFSTCNKPISGSSHLSLPLDLKDRFINSAVAYSMEYSESPSWSCLSVYEIHLIRSHQIIKVQGRRLKENFYKVPSTFCLRIESWFSVNRILTNVSTKFDFCKRYPRPRHSEESAFMNVIVYSTVFLGPESNKSIT